MSQSRCRVPEVVQERVTIRCLSSWGTRVRQKQHSCVSPAETGRGVSASFLSGPVNSPSPKMSVIENNFLMSSQKSSRLSTLTRL
jgi:hypothetical protein